MRVFLAVLAASGAIVIAFLLVLMNDVGMYDDSFKQSQTILRNFEAIAKRTEAYHEESGLIPDQHVIDDALMELRLPADTHWIAAPSETCHGNQNAELGQKAMASYRICMWRGEWLEEYSPQTGKHTLPTSISDYAPTYWLNALAALIALFLGYMAVRLVRGRPTGQRERAF